MSERSTVFMFSGQGSQYYQMGRSFFDGNAAFRNTVLQLSDVARPLLGRSIIDVLYNDGRRKDELFDEIKLTSAAIFIVEYALAKVLIDDGVKPDYLLASSMGIYAAAAIAAAVPVRLMKRDLLFVVERLASLLDESRLAVVAKQHGIKKAKDSDSIGKLFAAYLRRAEESALGGLLVEITILHAATRQNAAQVLRDAASAYKVDVDAIGLKVKQEFAAKEKAKKSAKANPSARSKTKKAA